MNLALKPFRLRDCRFFATLAACVVGTVGIASSLAQEPAKPTGPTPEQEAKFIATLTKATLKGRWSGIKDGQLTPEKEDSYTIVSVAKVEGEKWVVNARMAYGGKDIDLPIPVQVKWAGDTPVLVLDNIGMGTGRTYSARVMIYEKTYSGWWTGGTQGGLLNGLITNAKE
jgi:hypothetical protein